MTRVIEQVLRAKSSRVADRAVAWVRKNRHESKYEKIIVSDLAYVRFNNDEELGRVQRVENGSLWLNERGNVEALLDKYNQPGVVAIRIKVATLHGCAKVYIKRVKATQ